MPFPEPLSVTHSRSLPLRKAKTTFTVHSQPETFGQRIRAVRTAWKWSQLKMAGILGLDQATVSFWEQDKISPGGTSTVALSALFRMSVETLETGRGFVIPDPPSDLGLPDQKSFRSVSLPSITPEQMGIIDMVSGTATHANTSQAIIELTDALKDGRKVWMVLQ
jgi:transcriptional regulator with XRE-family HTH domain